MRKIRLWAAISVLAVPTLFYAALYRLGINPMSRFQKYSRGTEESIARGRHSLRAEFATTGVSYPPGAVTLSYFKDEHRLVLWAGARRIKAYAVLAASGGIGPKLREGDRQVPEGVYRIESLNPKSRFHLSLRVNYPNAFDLAQAKKESRTDLGGDIMIHGAAVSIGCLAIGDAAIEELYALATDTNFRSWKVLLSPTDFRKQAWRDFPSKLPWTRGLYQTLHEELQKLAYE